MMILMSEICNVVNGKIEGTRIPGVYMIKSLRRPDKCYFGSSLNIKQRVMRHMKDLRRGIHPNPKLQAHYIKYGEDDLEFSIVAACPPDEILVAEQHFLDNFSPWFNISPSAANSMGIKRSDETKRKISESQLGRIPWNKGLSKETNELVSLCVINRAKSYEKESHPNYGKHLSEETCRKIGKANKGKPHGGKSSSQWGVGHVPWNKGKRYHRKKPISDEERMNASNAAKRRGIPREQLDRMIATRKKNRISRNVGGGECNES